MLRLSFFPLQALSAVDGDGLTTIIRCWKVDPLVNFWEGDGLEARLIRVKLGPLSTGIMQTGSVMTVA